MQSRTDWRIRVCSRRAASDLTSSSACPSRLRLSRRISSSCFRLSSARAVWLARDSRGRRSTPAGSRTSGVATWSVPRTSSPTSGRMIWPRIRARATADWSHRGSVVELPITIGRPSADHHGEDVVALRADAPSARPRRPSCPRRGPRGSPPPRDRPGRSSPGRSRAGGRTAAPSRRSCDVLGIEPGREDPEEGVEQVADGLQVPRALGDPLLEVGVRPRQLLGHPGEGLAQDRRSRRCDRTSMRASRLPPATASAVAARCRIGRVCWRAIT